jgi:hypothetical protein
VRTKLASRWPSTYTSHKEHWQGWLWEYDGPGGYNRRVPKQPRSQAYIFSHLHNAPMMLWLAEAAGVNPALIEKADRVMRRLAIEPSPSSAVRDAAAFRKVIGWHLVASALADRGLV